MSTTKPKMLHLHRVRSNFEGDAATEARRTGNKSYVSRDRTRKRSPFTRKHPATAPGYIACERRYSAPFHQHVGEYLGAVSREEIGRLYVRKDGLPPAVDPFEAGDYVIVSKGPFADFTAEVVGKSKKGWLADVKMFGRECRVSLSTESMRKSKRPP
jgi:hypothetical protein